MTQKFLLCCSLATVVVVDGGQRVRAQSTFRNLDFEEARIIPIEGDSYYPRAVAPSNALPYWASEIGGSLVSRIHYDDISLGAAWISIHDTNSSWKPIKGNYSLLFQQSWDGMVLPSISQTGTLSTLAKSLSFMSGPGNPIRVSFNGVEIPLLQLGDPAHPSYTWAGDVSLLAGQTGTLKFWGNNWLDAIAFSTQAVLWPPRLTDPRITHEQALEFLLNNTRAGQTYAVQVSTNLVNWSTLTSVVGSGASVVITDPAATNSSARFYRCVSP